MANLYEFEISREVIEEITKDVGLSTDSDAKENIVDTLMSLVDEPNVFQKTLIDGKPGFHIRVGKVQTERFEGQGLHLFTHSSSEGYLDTLEFDRRLKSSLERQGVIFRDRTE